MVDGGCWRSSRHERVSFLYCKYVCTQGTYSANAAPEEEPELWCGLVTQKGFVGDPCGGMCIFRTSSVLCRYLQTFSALATKSQGFPSSSLVSPHFSQAFGKAPIQVLSICHPVDLPFRVMRSLLPSNHTMELFTQLQSSE